MINIIRCFLILTLTVLISSKLKSNLVTVAIVGTNDIHGSAFPTTLFRSDFNQTYTYGGLQIMASMIETIRSQHKGNFLYLDAGDQFQGGIESSPLVSSGQIMNDYFNSINLDGAAMGNHQFDFGPNFLFQYWSQRQKSSFNLAANIVSDKGQEEFMPNHKNIVLYQLQSGVKIGVIGLTTLQTPATTGTFSDGTFPAYQFLQYHQIVLKNSKLLRQKGANAIIIVSHVGNECNADNSYGIWDQSSYQSSKCSQTDQISQLISKLPVGTIDGVVQGHRHKFSHHFIKGVPVMGTINGGYYFNILYLKFYRNQIYQKIIEGPIPVCEKVFSNNGHCNFLSKDELSVAGELIEWDFHGVHVKKHEKIRELFETKWLPKMSQFLEPLTLNELVLERKFDRESPLGNLVTDLVDLACPGHDFVLLNQGGFRTIWFPGVLQFQHFYNMFPFSNQLISFQMTGYQLIKSLEILQSGKKSFYPTKHLRQRVKVYLNGTRELTNVTFYDGRPIESGKSYRGISMDFLMRGGDDFQNVIGKVYSLRKQIVLGEFRDLIKPKIIQYGVIKEQKVIDSSNPRLILDDQ